MIEQEPMQVRAEFAERLRVEVPITSDALVRGVSKVAKARFVSPAGIYHCDGARTENNNDLLKRSFSQQGQERVRRLRRDVHVPGSDCWLHGSGYCLSVV
jgi:hypothetical protein